MMLSARRRFTLAVVPAMLSLASSGCFLFGGGKPAPAPAPAAAPVTAGPTAAPTDPKLIAPPGDVRDAILAIEKRWNDALVARDTATVARILAEDFVYVAPNGYVARKKELLGIIADPRGNMDAITTRDVSVRRYGDAVIVVGWFRQSGSNSAGKYDSFIRYTDVYAWRNGQWLAVSAHSSTLPKAPGT